MPNVPMDAAFPFSETGTGLFEEPLIHSSAAEQRVFCLIRAVLKFENIQSISEIPALSAESKSLAVSSCRMKSELP